MIQTDCRAHDVKNDLFTGLSFPSQFEFPRVVLGSLDQVCCNAVWNGSYKLNVETEIHSQAPFKSQVLFMEEIMLQKDVKWIYNPW